MAENKNNPADDASQQQDAGKNQTINKPEAQVVDYGRSGQLDGNPRPLDKDEGKMNNGEVGGAK